MSRMLSSTPQPVAPRLWPWLLTASIALCSSALAQETPTTSVPRTNVLIFYVDDVGMDQIRGYDDLNFYDPQDGGYPYAYTPNIDSLIANGVRFSQARACPKCSPSRAALMSGRYPFRTGVGSIVAGPLGQPGKDTTSPSFLEFGMRPRTREFSLGHLAGMVGIDNGLFGKLHLQLGRVDGGTGDDYATHVLGFEEFRGTLRNLDNPPRPPGATTQSSFTYYYWIENGIRETIGTEQDPQGGEYATFRQHRRAADWLREDASEPFLALVCSSDAHGPFQWAPAEGGSAHGFGSNAIDGDSPPIHSNTRYRAKVEALDWCIGNVLDALTPDVRERTLVMFMADNGSSDLAFQPATVEARYPFGHPLWFPGEEVKQFSVAPYDPERLKGTGYEGGVRIPLVVSGALVKNPGRTINALVDMVDIFATVQDLYDVEDQDIPVDYTSDSISFLPLLRGAPDSTHARQFSHGAFFDPNGVGESSTDESQYYLRQLPSGEVWKIIQQRDPQTGSLMPDEFYEISNDPLELTNLGTTHPQYAALRQEFDDLLDS